MAEDLKKPEQEAVEVDELAPVEEMLIKETDEEIEAYIECYLALKAEADDINKKLEVLKTKLTDIAKLTADNQFQIGYHKVNLITCTSSKVDTKALSAKYPKIAEEFMKTTVYQQLRVK